MGLFDIFHKKEKTNDTYSTFKVGDWVTQYSSGYWKVVGVFPKYADEDYSYNGISWKKGDHLSDWIILKKGFSAKMKPSNGCEFVDAQWCKLVADDVLQSIETVFAENPKLKQKFDSAPDLPNPSVNSVWMKLSDEQVEAFSRVISALPERFTAEQFWTSCANYRQYKTDPSNATHILYLYSYLWEVNDDFEPLNFGPKIKVKLR